MAVTLSEERDDLGNTMRLNALMVVDSDFETDMNDGKVADGSLAWVYVALLTATRADKITSAYRNRFCDAITLARDQQGCVRGRSIFV